MRRTKGLGEPDPMLSAADVIAQLLDARLGRARITLLFDRYCRLLRDAGVPLDRASLSLRHLHPQLIATSYHWDIESGGAAEVGRRHEVLEQEEFLQSPIRAVFDAPQVIRRRFDQPLSDSDYQVMSHLRAQGYSDYRVSPIWFSGGRHNVVTLATRRAGGFSEADLALVDATQPAFASVAELAQQRDTGRTLLSTYLGPRTGQRVWEGSIRRGHGETLFAVVFLCDLRGFTQLAAAQSLDETIAMLNDYFDAMGGALERHGGEILKFMGDALLAIFPCPHAAAQDCAVAASALAAARDGLASLAQLNAQRQASQRATLAAGVALSVGDVHYGNIGVADRLDFTVIGPAVNLAARIQGLTAGLGEPILLSGDIRRRLAEPTRSCGTHALKGVAGLTEVFAP